MVNSTINSVFAALRSSALSSLADHSDLLRHCSDDASNTGECEEVNCPG